MPVTFVITTDSGPTLGTPVAAQLPAFGSFSSPDTLLLTPGAALSLTFTPDTFVNTNEHTTYYALCANNTPLPSWISFDPSSLTFSGIAPQASSPTELPQNYGIELTASEVAGFAQAVAYFELVIENNLFAFGNSLQIINATIGSLVNFTNLQNDLTLDGQPIERSDLSQITSDAPSWLSLSNDTLAIFGKAPASALQQNFTVTITNRFGDSASIVILIQIAGNSSANLIKPIATLNATIGTNFTYALNASLLSTGNVNITVDSGTASAWLEFNSSSLTLYGHVPSNLKPQTVQFNVSASQGSQSQSQIVDVDVICGNLACPYTSSHTGAPRATASVGTATGAGGSANKSWIAAAVLLPLAVCLGFFILWCCRRRKGWKLRLGSISRKPKIVISRPVEMEKDGSPQGRTISPWNGDENHERLSSSEASESPKLPLVPYSKTKRNSRSRLSRITTRGADRSPRPDSWQAYVRRVDPSRQKQPAVVPEFSLVPKEQKPGIENATINGSQVSATADFEAPGLPRLQKRSSNIAYGGFRMFPGRPPSGFGHGRRVPSVGGSSLSIVNRGVGHGDGNAPQGPPGWGIVRNLWRNLSQLSWTSTQSSPNSSDPIVEEGLERARADKSFASMLSSFPRPSTSNMIDISTKPHVIHEASDDDESDIAILNRLPTIPPIARSKSQFRRKNSTKNEALQDFHKRRLQQKSHNPLFSAHLSSSRKSSLHAGRMSLERPNKGAVVTEPVTPPEQMIPRSYSQSSSLEPPSFKSRSARSSRSISSPQGKKSRINYHFTIRALSPLRRSRSSYASTTGSSKFSDPVGIAPFYPHGALLEETDDEGNKHWRYPNHPNPLGANRPGNGKATDVSDIELIDSLRAAGQYRAAQRLDYLRAQTEGNGAYSSEADNTVEVHSARGRRLDHKSGLKSGDSGNKSLEGDIGDAGGSSAFM